MTPISGLDIVVGTLSRFGDNISKYDVFSYLNGWCHIDSQVLYILV